MVVPVCRRVICLFGDGPGRWCACAVCVRGVGVTVPYQVVLMHAQSSCVSKSLCNCEHLLLESLSRCLFTPVPPGSWQ